MPRQGTGVSEITANLQQGMGPVLHWFPEDVPVSRLATVLVGMANTRGGRVILGVSPRAAMIQGVHDPAGVVDKVFQAALLSSPPLVLPVPKAVKLPESPYPVLVVIVPEGLPNVYSLEGSYLGRDGRQTNPLPARRLRELLMERGVIQFEARIPPQSGLEDLDIDQVNSYLEILKKRDAGLRIIQGEEGWKEILVRRGCLVLQEGVLRPTYAGLLMFGRYPQQWLPNASILAARFQGQALSDSFIKKEIGGTLIEQLRQAEAFLMENLRRVVRLTGLAHEETTEYPFEAVRELLVNAVAHRDYNIQGDTIHLNIFSTHLEVASPGGLPGPVNLNNLLEARFSRNAVIVQMLSDLGYVERLGYGLDRVVTVLRQRNMRLPRFEEVAGCFKVTLFGMEDESPREMLHDLSAYQAMDLNSRQQAAIGYLAYHTRITNSAYAELCPEVHAETLRRDLVDLVQRGVLIKIGDKRSTYYILKK